MGILGPPFCGIGATIRIGREILCLLYAGFLITEQSKWQWFEPLSRLTILFCIVTNFYVVLRYFKPFWNLLNRPDINYKPFLLVHSKSKLIKKCKWGYHRDGVSTVRICYKGAKQSILNGNKNQVRPGIRPSHWIYHWIILVFLVKTCLFGENLINW